MLLKFRKASLHINFSFPQVYLSDLSPPSHRGALGALGASAISAGVTLVYLLGALLPWRGAALACAQPPLMAALALALLCPDSPAWLAGRGRMEEAGGAIKW